MPCHKVSCMGQESISKLMGAQILKMIRLKAGTKKGQTHHIVLNVVSVLAVIQEGCAVVSL